MRIITGKAKGCRLKAPRGMTTRPTADRVKESLFNILGRDVAGARVLDLFAGTGNLGLEALSRGAAAAAFVDQSAESVRVIRENALHTKLIDQAQIIRGDVFSALRRFAHSKEKFNLLFCDPPYLKNLAQETLKLLDKIELLAENSVVVIEHDCKDDLELVLDNLVFQRRQVYGQTAISFFLYKKMLPEAARWRAKK